MLRKRKGTDPAATAQPTRPAKPQPPAAPPPPAQTQPGSRTQFLWRLAVAGFLLLPVAAIGVWYVTRPAPPPLPEVSLDGTDPEVRAAIEADRKKLLDEPRSADAWGRHGMVLRAHNFDAAADQCFTEAERLNPNDARWPYFRGLHAEFGQTDGVPRGLPHFRRAVQATHPDLQYRGTARLRLAEALLDRQQFDESESVFREALSETPDNPRATFGLGQIAVARGDIPAARASLTAVAGHPAVRQKVASQLAALAQRAGNSTEATRQQEQAARFGPDADWPDPFVQECFAFQVGLKARLREVEALEQAGQVHETIPILLRAVQTNPSVQIYLKLGAALGKTGDTTAAEHYLREALRLDPNSERAHHLLGLTLFFQAKGKPATDRSAARALFQECAEHFRQSLSRKPDNAEGHRCLGQALFDLGQKDEAIEQLRLAITCRPEQYEGHLYLGEVLADVGQKDEALRQLRTAAQFAPPTDPRPGALIDRLTKGKN